jgi:hypothetical protein
MLIAQFTLSAVRRVKKLAHLEAPERARTLGAGRVGKRIKMSRAPIRGGTKSG